jgi:PAS domain S-box-containing protein
MGPHLSLGIDVLSNEGFVEHWGTKEGLLHEQVYAFAEARDGAYWFGTLVGLSRFRDGKWKHWLADTLKSSAPRSQKNMMTRIFALTIDPNDNVWFCDRMSGISRIDPNDSVARYSTHDGLINDEVWDLRADSLGRIWAATNGGLSCYQNETWTSFTSQEGLLSSTLWPILPIGDRVYVGSRGVGISILSLSNLSTEAPVIVLDEPAQQERGTVFKWHSYGFWGEPASGNILTRYRLDQSEWSHWAASSSKTLADLKPGTHVIAVQSLGLFGAMSKDVAIRYFTIDEKFYRTPLFLVPTVGLTLLAFALSASSIVRKRKQDARLRASEAKFRAITETTSSAILIYDSQKIFFANPGTELLTGYSMNELLAMSPVDLFGANYFNAVNSPSHRSKRMELRILTKSGDERWVDLTEGPIDFYDRSAIVGTGFDITERKKAESAVLANREQLRSLASELSQTEERERRRMAGFLHDTIGQALALCKMKLSALQRAAEGKPFQGLLSEAKSYLDQSIQNTRSLTFELSPPILHELGLVAALEWLAEQTEAQHHIRIVCTDDGEDKPVSDELRPLLFHAVRELLINVVKHAQAQNVTIVTKRLQESISIVVSDDGIGVDLEVTTARSKQSGFGLFNIRERLTYLGGHMQIFSPQNGGTQVQLSAPIETLQKN